MPYFSDLHDLVNDLSNWADLRHEQGVDVQSTLKTVRQVLEQARKKMRNAQPDADALLREPNTLPAIRALRPKGPRKIGDRLREAPLRDKLKGAWLGRATGCTLGAVVENWSITDMERLARRNKTPFPPVDYWTAHPTPERIHYGKSTTRDFLRDGLTCVPADDDLAYTLLGLLILEDYGPNFTTADVGEAWLRYLPIACTAEEVALTNLKAGVSAAKAGEKNNPYQEWIGADIRSDPWAYACPGWPEKAAEFAYRDAFLSHRQNGIYGAMFFAAAIAAAFVVDCPIKALKIGLTEIPAKCRLAVDVAWALKKGPKLRNWRAAREAVDARFEGMHPVHTNNNACLTIFGLILGKQDFTQTIAYTVAMGLDNDCTAATAGSLLGAILGARGIPEHWWKPFRNKAHTYLNRQSTFTNVDIVQRFMDAAQTVWSE